MSENECAKVSLDKPGEVIYHQGDSTGYCTIIKRADPVAKFSDEVLLAALTNPGWPDYWLSVELPSCDMPGCGEGAGCWMCTCLCTGTTHSTVQCFMGAKVTCLSDAQAPADKSGQSFVYIIKGYDLERHCWIGAWPD